MVCYKPVTAWKKGYKQPLSFKPIYDNHSIGRLQISCGQCVGCRLTRSREWAIRCVHESKMHKDNIFITLTYDSEKMPMRPEGVPPADISLYYEDFQLFMKRLRKKFGSHIRFYMCGEYGEEFGRPHFHAIIFGMDFADKKQLMRTLSGSIIYRSETLEKLWQYGFSSIGQFDYKSAAYVARYVMKKVTGDPAASHYQDYCKDTGEVFDKTPEFNRMSLKPGIGGKFFDVFRNDIYPHDHVIINGKPVKPPRYYDKLLERMTSVSIESPITFNNGTVIGTEFYTKSEFYDNIKAARQVRALLHKEDNTEERLTVKEQVCKASLEKLKRKLR